MDDALIYGSLQIKGLVYTQYGQKYVLVAHLGWVGLNT